MSLPKASAMPETEQQKMTKYEELKAVLTANADAENAVSMAAYMKNRFTFYGIPSPKRKELTKPFIKAEKAAGTVDWAFLDECYADEHREMQYFVNDCLGAMGKFLRYDDIPRLENYARTKQWWDTIDFLDKIIGNIGRNDKRVDELMLAWSECDDMWLRRLSIDHQNGRKEKTDTALLEKILVNNLGSDEFFINKAIGWSLRDYSKIDPDWVRSFLERHGDKMAKLSLKEASKYI